MPPVRGRFRDPRRIPQRKRSTRPMAGSIPLRQRTGEGGVSLSRSRDEGSHETWAAEEIRTKEEVPPIPRSRRLVTSTAYAKQRESQDARGLDRRIETKHPSIQGKASTWFLDEWKDRGTLQKERRGKMRMGETSLGRSADVGKQEACYAVPSSKSLLMAAAMQRFVRNHHGQAENVEDNGQCEVQAVGAAEHGRQENDWTRKESQKEAGPREMLMTPTAGDWSCLLEFFLSMQKSVEAIETNLDLGRKMQQGYLDESFLALLDIVEGLGTNTKHHASNGDTVGVWKTLDKQAERLQRRCSEHCFARWNTHAGSASI